MLMTSVLEISIPVGMPAHNSWHISLTAYHLTTTTTTTPFCATGELCTVGITLLAKNWADPTSYAVPANMFLLVHAVATEIKMFSGFVFKICKVIDSNFKLSSSFELKQDIQVMVVVLK